MRCPKCRMYGVYKPYVGKLYRCLVCGWFGETPR